jgi:hypothetical protein
MEPVQDRAVEAIDQGARERVQRLGRMGGFDLQDRDQQRRAAFVPSLILMEPGVNDTENVLARSTRGAR